MTSLESPTIDPQCVDTTGWIAQAACAVLAGQLINRATALRLLQTEGPALYDLLYWANRIRLKFFGPRIHLCSIASARTGACSEDCKFCSQSQHHQAVVQPAVADARQLLTAAREAATNGAHCFGIVTSGSNLTDTELDRLTPVLRTIAADAKIRCCASLGTLTDEHARRLRAAGVTRYNHNLETSQRFFPQIVSTHRWEDRRATVRAAQRAGMQVCCGGIIGLGETLEDRVDLALSLRELQVDTVPLNFLHAIAGTPLASVPPIPPMQALQTIAMFRFVMPDRPIKVAGGREKCLRDLQSWMFFAGASGCLIGNYLTTPGRSPADDRRMLSDLGCADAPSGSAT